MKQNIKAFTVAELVIVIAVLGIISATVAMSSIKSAPNDKLLKFRKAHMMLTKGVEELSGNKVFYTQGDFSKKADGSIVPHLKQDGIDYFCDTLSTMLAAEKVNCAGIKSTPYSFYEYQEDNKGKITPDCASTKNPKALDMECSCNLIKHLLNGDFPYRSKIVNADNITFAFPLGVDFYNISQKAEEGGTCFGSDIFYQPVCVSLEEFNMDINNDSSVDELDYFACEKALRESEDYEKILNYTPFAYGVRRDGKIILGEKTQQWLKRLSKDN